MTTPMAVAAETGFCHYCKITRPAADLEPFNLAGNLACKSRIVCLASQLSLTNISHGRYGVETDGTHIATLTWAGEPMRLADEPEGTHLADLYRVGRTAAGRFSVYLYRAVLAHSGPEVASGVPLEQAVAAVLLAGQ